MKSTLVLLSLLTFSGLYAWENPACRLHSDNVTFHASFDQGDGIADMAGGKAEPSVGKNKEMKIADGGLFGKALESGGLTYKGEGNMDLARPGTVILWVAPTWDGTKPESGKEPGFMAFAASGRTKEYGYDLIMGKMGGQPWGHGHINNYVQYRPATIKHVNCVRYATAKTSKWPRGEWRMLACTWGPGTFTNSVNGKPSASSSLMKMTSGTTDSFALNCSGPILLDEVVILNKALTDAELAQIYQETMAELKKAEK